jgi:hypothetical protein
MKHYMIPLAALLLALWACAPPVPPPPPPPPARLTSVACPGGSDLLTHVHYTQLSVQPSREPNSVQPNRDFTYAEDPTPIDPHIQENLAAAFTANPNFSRNELCPLDDIFINRVQCSGYDPSTCAAMRDVDVADNSWGLRTPPPVSKKYIAISLGLWRCPSGPGYCAPSFTQYQQRLNKALLDRTARHLCDGNIACTPVSVSPPIFQISPGGGPDTPALTILAALTHERGHIWWWEKFVTPPGSPSISNTATFCSPTPFYPGGLWPTPPGPGRMAVQIPDHRFVSFGELRANSPFAIALARNPAGAVDAIYASGQYPSLFASYSPDEDFVEAFEWSVLSHAGLSDLSVNINGVGQHIFQPGQLRIAEAKLGCFDQLSSRGGQQQR